MTEYDFSPEAYDRYLATQTRIANWVDNTERHRSQFQAAIPTGTQQQASRSAGQSSKSTPAPSPHRYQQQQQQYGQPYAQPRQLHVHATPESESSEEYGDGPGPMPLHSAGVMPMYAPQPYGGVQAYHYPQQPMVAPQMMLQQHSYGGIPSAPHHKSSHRHRHGRSRSHQPTPYYGMTSPPVSPGYQYAGAYGPVMSMSSGGHSGAGGYFVMQPQRQMPMMSDPPRSAPPNVSAFGVPVLPIGDGYLHPLPHPNVVSAPVSAGQHSPSPSLFGPPSLPLSPASSPGPSAYQHPHQHPPWSTYALGSPSGSLGSQSHSAMSSPAMHGLTGGTAAMDLGGRGAGDSGLPAQQQQMHYFTGVPQYQGMHTALGGPGPPGIAGPAMLSPPSNANTYLLPHQVPYTTHRRVYDLSTGSSSKHYLRHSVG